MNQNEYLLQLSLSLLILSLSFQFILPIGWVGEVAALWGPIPQTSLAESLSCVGNICFYATRPLLRWGEFPLMLNVYTAAFPDWLPWIAYRLFEHTGCIRILQIVTTGLATTILVWQTRHFLSKQAQWWFWGWLLTDWSYIFYKKALGNTEILLQLAVFAIVIDCLNGSKLRHPNTAPRMVAHHLSPSMLWICLGLWSKITFLLILPPIFACACLKDVPAGQRDGTNFARVKPLTFGVLLGIAPAIVLMLWSSNLRLPLQSHDFWSMQWQRILLSLSETASSNRENSLNLWTWFVNPLTFIQETYHASHRSWLDSALFLWMKIGLWFSLLLMMIQSFFFDARNNEAHLSGLQRLTVLLFSQLMLLGWLAKDLHHLAMLSPVLGLWMVWVVEGVGLSRPLKISWALGWLIVQSALLEESAATISTTTTPSFSQDSQKTLIQALQTHQVQRLVTMDYEVYGMLELYLPQTEILHMWPTISTARWSILPSILRENVDSHLLVIQPSTPMIYSLYPSQKRLEDTARDLELHILPLEHNRDFSLYKITAD